MPFNYLSGNESNIYAMNRMGSAFTDALVGLAQLKQRQEALRQQYAVEGQYLDLARQRESREAEKEKTSLETQRRTQKLAGNVGSAVGQLYQPTPQNAQISPFMPQVPTIDPRAMAMQSYMANLAELGAMHTPGAMMQPQSFAQGSQIYPPMMFPGAQPIGQVPYEPRPLSAYDQGRLNETKAFHAQQQALGLINLLARLPQIQSQIALQKAQTEKAGRWTMQEWLGAEMGEGATGAPAPMTATNPKTGQRIQSLDGGKTWQPIQ